MAFIGNKEKNFQKYLEKQFGIILPPSVGLFYAKGIRIGDKDLMKSQIHGELGYAACDFGFNPTNAVIQNFGYLAKKNVVTVDEPTAKLFAAGKDIVRDLGIKNKYVIMKYNEHILGLGHYDRGQKKIRNKIPEKRRRDIVNSI